MPSCWRCATRGMRSAGTNCRVLQSHAGKPSGCSANQCMRSRKGGSGPTPGECGFSDGRAVEDTTHDLAACSAIGPRYWQSGQSRFSMRFPASRIAQLSHGYHEYDGIIKLQAVLVQQLNWR